MHFCDVHFPLGEMQILETRCIKQDAFVVDPLRESQGVSNAHTLIFLTHPPSKTGRLKPRRGIEIQVPRRSRVEISTGPRKGPIPTEKRANTVHSQ